MELIISSPTKNIIYNNLKKVTLPSVSGELQILPNYAETFLIIKKGIIFFINSENIQKKITLDSEAQCYIKNNQITILI